MRWLRAKSIRAVALVACGLAALAVATASTAGPAQEKSYTFAYGNVTDNSPLFKLVGDLMVSDGKKVSITVRRFNNNFDGPTALNNAQLMVQQKPDLVINWTGVEAIGNAVGEVFKRANMPCIAVNQKIPGCPFFNLVNRDLGIGAAKIVIPIMKKKGWTAKDTTLILVASPGAGAEVNSNSRYFYTHVSRAIPGMAKATPTSITDKTTNIGKLPNGIQVDGKASLEPTYNAVKATLQILPKDRHLVVFTINDDSALGAWRAITQDGRQKNTLIIGQGANAQGLKHLRTNPSWVAEGSVFFELWPRYLLAMGVAVLNGARPPVQTYAPQIVLSKQNVAKFYGKSGTLAKVAPPLPAPNQYLLRTGILQKFGSATGG
jgi:ribose transport system substrate-binding protein